MNLLAVLLFIPVALLVFPSTSHAIDMEFYTYGGFDAMVAGFQRIALISSDTAYKGLFFTTAAFGAAFAFWGMTKKGIGWKNALAFHIGVAIYFGLMIPTGNVWVYDTVLNRNQQVAGVPDLIVITAGGLNTIKRVIIDIINTSGDPIEYQQAAGGVGPKMLYEAATHNYSLDDAYMQETLQDYMNQCVLFEMFRPGSDININDVNSNTTDFTADLLAKANSPAIYTVVYTAANPQGTPTTCSDSWGTYLQPYLTNATNYNKMVESVCMSSGYDPGNATELTQCRTTVFPAWIQQATGTALTSDVLLRQAYISNQLMFALSQGDPDPQASLAFAAQAQGAYSFADEWMPYMEAIMSAQTLAFAPFLLLFLPTPIWLKIYMFIFGLLLYPTIWGIVDASLHQFAIDQSVKVYRDVQANKLGLKGLAFLTDGSTKILNMWWYTRASGMAIAGVITGIFVAFGHAAGQFVGHMEKGAHAAGDQAGTKTLTPSGMAGELKTYTGVTVPALYSTSKYGVRGMADSATINELSQTGGNMEVRDHYGSVPKASRALSTRNAFNSVNSVTAAQKEIEGMGGFENAVSMMSDSQARGDMTKAKETAHLIAAAGGMTNLTDSEALAFASQARESMDRTNTKYGTLAKELYGNDTSANRLKAAETQGKYQGARDAGEAGALLTSAAYDKLSHQVGHGVNQMAMSHYGELLKTKGSNLEAFKEAIKGDRQLEAIDQFVTGGKENATMSDRADSFDSTLNQTRSDLGHKMGRFKALDEYGRFAKEEDLLKAWGLQDNDRGRVDLAEFERTGLLTKGMANSANSAYGFKPGEGPFKANMKVDDYGLGKGGKLMINRAAYQGKDGAVTVANGEISTSQAMNKGQLEKYVLDQEKHGHAAQAFAAKEIAARLHSDEAAIVQERKGLDNNLISSNIMHGSDAELKSGGGESVRIEGGQVVKEGTVIGKNVHELQAQAGNANFDNVEDAIKPGMRYRQSYGFDKGHSVLTGMAVRKEGEANYTDLSQEKKGRSSQEIDEATQRIDHGLSIGKAGQMAIAADPALLRPVADKNSPETKPGSKAWDAKVQAITDSLVNDAKAVYSREGLSLNTAEGSASLGIGGYGVGVGGKFGTQSRDQKQWNLLNSNIKTLTKQSLVEAWGKKLNGEDAAKYATEKVHDYLKENIYDPAEKLKPGAFGATAPTTALVNGDGTNNSHMKVSDEMIAKNPSLATLKKE